MSNLTDSRFFTFSDTKIDKLIFRLPNTWWSRLYEYAWAIQFAEKDDVALDAGCGIVHPLKFYLSDQSREVYACDLDKRILIPEEILKEIKKSLGKESDCFFPTRYLSQVKLDYADLKNLPYQDEKFKKIYCISVLEHMGLKSVIACLKEFRRVLQDDGVVIITFDYPNITPRDFNSAVEDAKLTFAGSVMLDMPEDAMYSDIYGRHYCYRAVLKKDETK